VTNADRVPDRVRVPGGFRIPSTVDSLREAADQLGISVQTVRRRIRTGELKAERIACPQGFAWRIHLSTGDVPDVHGWQPTDRVTDPSNHAVGQPTSQATSPPSLQPSMDVLRADAMAAYSARLMEPLLMRLDQKDSVIVRQAEQIGQLTAELQAAREQLSVVQAPQEEEETGNSVLPVSPVDQVEPSRARPRPSWWRRVFLGE
jgi:excisionase family DNA binding protein